MKPLKNIYLAVVGALLSVSLLNVSCSDEPAADNYYTFKGEMVSDYLQNRSGQFSDFIAVLQRSGMYGMMATYGTYTCLAPTNDAFRMYLQQRGLQSVDQLSKQDCDTISWNHIIKYTYFTTDLTDGNIPNANMNDRYLTFSCRSDEANNNNVAYYINQVSKLVVRDDSVENGVVHTLDHVIQPSTEYLPELMGNDKNISLFYSALLKTGMRDSLYEYLDMNYFCGEDSVNKGIDITTVVAPTACTTWVSERSATPPLWSPTPCMRPTASTTSTTSSPTPSACTTMCTPRMPTSTTTTSPTARTP